MHVDMIPASAPLHSLLTVSAAELQSSTICLLCVPLSNVAKKKPSV
jgi:hypothetical protein